MASLIIQRIYQRKSRFTSRLTRVHRVWETGRRSSSQSESFHEENSTAAPVNSSHKETISRPSPVAPRFGININPMKTLNPQGNYPKKQGTMQRPTFQENSQNQLKYQKHNNSLPFDDKYDRFQGTTHNDSYGRINESLSTWKARLESHMNKKVSKSENQSIDSKTKDSGSRTMKDMTDISLLRAALLRSTSLQNSNQLEKRDDGYHPRSKNKSAASAEFRQALIDANMKAQDAAKEWRRKQLESGKEERQKLLESNDLSFQVQNLSFWEKEVPEHKIPGLKSRKPQVRNKIVILPPNPASVMALSALFKIKVTAIVKKLISFGIRDADENTIVDLDTMEVMALDFHLEPTRSNRRASMTAEEEKRALLSQQRRSEVGEDILSQVIEDEKKIRQTKSLPFRPPVVCILGHVDHGKTTLMDALRRRQDVSKKDMASHKKKIKLKNKQFSDSNDTKRSHNDGVAGTEAGGITQVISAFQVPMVQDDFSSDFVTFLDTPGHAAFRAMRESGSHAADVIVLVVAADDGVSRQTVEILNVFKSIYKELGGISLVVAMTKIDKPGIDVKESQMRIEGQLMEHGIITEAFSSTMSQEGEFGSPVQLVPVSGLTGEGIDELMESLSVQSEVMELRADPSAPAEGIILDACIERGIGIVVSCIVRWGTMKVGDIVLSGVHMGKVKALKDSSGNAISECMPSQHVRILGFRSMPKAGEPITCVQSEEVAETLIERRIATGGADGMERVQGEGPKSIEVTGVAAQLQKLQSIHEKYNFDLEDVSNLIRIPVFLKADADGTLCALRDAVVEIGEQSSLNVLIDPIGQSIGPLSATEVEMAKESNAVILSFNVNHTNKDALILMNSLGVVMKSSNVIYSILDEAKTAFAYYLPTVKIFHVHGKAVVKKIFVLTFDKQREIVAGLSVSSGTLFKSKVVVSGASVPCYYRIYRNGKLITHDTITVSSLKKVKDSVEQVRFGEECGMALKGFDDFYEGDEIECYTIEEKREFF